MAWNAREGLCPWARLLELVLIAAATGFAVGTHAEAPAQRALPTVTPLVSSGQTIKGETIAYPAGSPRVLAVVVALTPGQEKGCTHGVPAFGYVLEGELTVDYGDKGRCIDRAGEAVLEAMSTPNNDRNTGAGTMRILAVFMGVEGRSTSQTVKN